MSTSYDWYVGQKIVCIKDDKFEGTGKLPSLVARYLKRGNIYTIAEIVMQQFGTLPDPQIAFRLEGINHKVYYRLQDIVGDYFFFHGRFKPLEEDDSDEKIDISLFQGLLVDVNSGKVTFDDDTFREDVVERRI